MFKQLSDDAPLRPWTVKDNRVYSADGREIAVATKADPQARLMVGKTAELIRVAVNLFDTIGPLYEAVKFAGDNTVHVADQGYCGPKCVRCRALDARRQFWTVMRQQLSPTLTSYGIGIHEALEGSEETRITHVSFNMPPLLVECPKCDGVGQIADEAWIEYVQKQNREFPKTLADLGVTSGLSFDEWKDLNPPPPGPEEPICSECEGEKKVLTPTGQQIAAVILPLSRRVAALETKVAKIRTHSH